jgi:uncharacterized RDD family membrane protein YckC
MELVNPPLYANTPSAGAGERIGAYLIDAVLIALVIWVPFFGWVVAPLYLLTRDALPFLQGQSVGKRLIGLRAVDQNGAALTNNYQGSVLRNVLFIIPIMPIVELIVMLADKDGLRLGDKLAQTRVVRAA